ncbi:MAG: hypothetical protein JW863_13475 [Chitinispirillaceae bacterium]|nr:hypothetical protein [Chitinispirillaceae bacterium]
MKFKHLLLIFSFAVYTLAAGAGEFQISGTVTKKGGGQLEGVAVLLKGKNVSVTTSATGTFNLIPPVAVRMNAEQKQTLSFTLRGNAVAFSQSAGKLSGNVTILSPKGRLIASTYFTSLNPATDQIMLPQLASGYNIIRVTVNNEVYTCPVMQLGSELHLFNKNAINSSVGNFTLTKIATAAVDTIVASKTGFENAVLPVESYTLSNVSIAMDSAVAGEIAWGKEEDPTINCKVTGVMPEYSALKADSKLPDPFMKLDGTRIKNKSEWACRREEIRQQLLKYVYGDKPIPAKGSVSGTVSSSKISVKVSEGGKSCSFDANVDMNGATAPAPAIIIYDGGMGSSTPIPKGVARIIFRAIEGGAGAKTGPFFTFYGSNHPAGYMVAQAWQVSRIMDLLQQNPEIIDPDRVGTNGCSRNAKGAFVGGLLDNRIALTLPEESGIGGTVGLRLKQYLDPGESESPYAAISYVRWLSDVALGPFTSGHSESADNTERLPVDMHEAMALIAPRAIYIMDNPSILDPKSAYVTAMAGQAIFKALGVGDRFTYQGASGGHCQWRTQYEASLNATIERFLKGKESTTTGNFTTDLGGKPNVAQYYNWDATELPGKL